MGYFVEFAAATVSDIRNYIRPAEIHNPSVASSGHNIPVWASQEAQELAFAGQRLSQQQESQPLPPVSFRSKLPQLFLSPFFECEHQVVPVCPVAVTVPSWPRCTQPAVDSVRPEHTQAVQILHFACNLHFAFACKLLLP